MKKKDGRLQGIAGTARKWGMSVDSGGGVILIVQDEKKNSTFINNPQEISEKPAKTEM